MDHPNHRTRRSLRLKGYDYRQPGAYFMTICTHRRMCVLGAINNAGMQLSEIGQIVDSSWKEIPKHFPVALMNGW